MGEENNTQTDSFPRLPPPPAASELNRALRVILRYARFEVCTEVKIQDGVLWVTTTPHGVRTQKTSTWNLRSF